MHIEVPDTIADNGAYELDATADNSFVICRFSGTEPLLRIFAEASDEAAARGFVTAFRELLALE